MHQEEILEAVRDFADQSHGDQMRKYTPERYIVHPVRVMEVLKEYTSDTQMLAAALLHDVLEDTPVKKADMLKFLLTVMDEKMAKETLELVVELTDVYIKANYPQLNRKKRKSLELERMAKTSAESQTIKYADIIDNCNEIVKHDRHFASVFLIECLKNLEVMEKGNPKLRERAMQLLKGKLRELKGTRRSQE
jgi:guanosine-3',5'-bis(diphosphate) 3'-pyrophosphohydrolase